MPETKATTPPPIAPGPYACEPIAIKPEWIDYNGHLNMAYYNVVFDHAVDEFFEKILDLGPSYLTRTNRSTMTAEIHVRYLREVKLQDPVQCLVWLLEVDEKRIHVFGQLRHATEGWVSATTENMILHVDMTVRKVAPFPPDIQARLRAIAAAHASEPRPEGVGRRIAMPGK